MNDEFDRLRVQAKEKRDAAIARAQRDYKRTLACITELRKVMRVASDHVWREPEPGQPLTLREAMLAALRDRKMTKVELVVAVLEMGYKSKMPKQEVFNSVAKILRKDGRFKRVGEKWSLVG